MKKSRVLKTAGIVSIFVIIWSAFDRLSYGFILDWINREFFYTNINYYDYEGQPVEVHETFPDWDRWQLLIFVIILLAIGISLFVIFRKEDQHKKKMTKDVHQLLQNFIDHNDVKFLSKEYEDINYSLLEIHKQVERQAQMVELQSRQKNDLISYLAHDMKTPLASVIGYLSLLNDVSDIPKQLQEKYVGITLDKANRLEDLIDEFFDVTRFNLHEIILTKGRIELNFMFQQLVEQFYPVLLRENKQIAIDIPEGLSIYGDADKLARAFNNIIKNAISYSYEHTCIQIHVDSNEQEVIIDFHNQGDEIPKQKLTTIFEKFYRLDKARSTNSGGAGLGLAIAKEIVEAHEGSISAQSTMKETVFHVLLPVMQGD